MIKFSQEALESLNRYHVSIKKAVSNHIPAVHWEDRLERFVVNGYSFRLIGFDKVDREIGHSFRVQYNVIDGGRSRSIYSRDMVFSWKDDEGYKLGFFENSGWVENSNRS